VANAGTTAVAPQPVVTRTPEPLAPSLDKAASSTEFRSLVGLFMRHRRTSGRASADYLVAMLGLLGLVLNRRRRRRD